MTYATQRVRAQLHLAVIGTFSARVAFVKTSIFGRKSCDLKIFPKTEGSVKSYWFFLYISDASFFSDSILNIFSFVSGDSKEIKTFLL